MAQPGEIPANGIDDDRNGYVDDVYGIDAITGSGDPYDDNGPRMCAVYGSWSATQIKCRVPAQAWYGAVKVTVTTAAGTRNAVSFTVKR